MDGSPQSMESEPQSEKFDHTENLSQIAWIFVYACRRTLGFGLMKRERLKDSEHDWEKKLVDTGSKFRKRHGGRSSVEKCQSLIRIQPPPNNWQNLFIELDH